MLPDIGMTEGVRHLWEKKKLLDYTIKAQDQEFMVHKVIMASVSPYFESQLTSPLTSGTPDMANLEEFSGDVVSNIIEFVYTGQFSSIHLPFANKILECADFLLMSSAVQAYLRQLLKEMNKKNCFHVMAVLQNYQQTGCKQAFEYGEQALDYIRSNIHQIIPVCDLDTLPMYGFVKYLGFIDTDYSEWEMFCIIKRWINANDVYNREDLNCLLSEIHFCLMTSDEIEAIKKMDMYTETDGPWRNRVDEAAVYHSKPAHLKVLECSRQNKVRNDPSPICFSLADSNRFYTVQGGMSWKALETHSAPEFGNGVAAVAEVNDFLIVCEGFSINQKWHIFNPRTKCWAPMASMEKPRDRFPVVFLDKHLYVFGGVQLLDNDTRVLVDSIEQYDFATNKWNMTTYQMPELVCEHSACVINDCNYIASGLMVEGEQNWSRKLDCFVPSSGTWQRKANMLPCPGRKVRVLDLFGEKVLFTINASLHMQYYKPSTNQWCLSSCIAMRSNLRWNETSTVLPVQSTLFFLNFDSEGEESGVCMKSEEGVRASEYRMDRFPYDLRQSPYYFSASLRVPAISGM